MPACCSVPRSQRSRPSPSPTSIRPLPNARPATGDGGERCEVGRRSPQSDDIDVVDICTPNDNHVDIALDALAARQARAVREAAGARRRQLLPVVRGGADSDRVTQVGFVYRQWPAVAMARKLIDEGAIGDDPHGAGPVPARLQRQSRRADELAVRQGPSRLGRPRRRRLALHRSLAVPRRPDLAGRRGACRRSSPSVADRDGSVVDVTVDDQTEILADFESGASGTILASWAGTGHKCDLGFEVIGSQRLAERSPGSGRTSCSSSTAPTPRIARASARSWSARRIPVPTASTPSPRRASATPTRSRSRRATRCATSPPARCCRARPSSTVCASPRSPTP